MSTVNSFNNFIAECSRPDAHPLRRVPCPDFPIGHIPGYDGTSAHNGPSSYHPMLTLRGKYDGTRSDYRTVADRHRQFRCRTQPDVTSADRDTVHDCHIRAKINVRMNDAPCRGMR